MEEKILLANGIVNLPQDTLVSLYFLLTDEELQKLLRVGSKRNADRGNTAFQHRLERKVAEAGTHNVTEVSLRLLSAWQKGLRLSPQALSLPSDLELAAENIISECRLRIVKEYPDFPYTPAEAYLFGLCAAASEEIAGFSREKLHDGINAAVDYIALLPDELQELLAVNFGVGKITAAAIEGLVDVGGLEAALLKVAQTAGFSVSAGIVSLLTGTGGVVALPLLFSETITIISLTEVFANPLFSVRPFARSKRNRVAQKDLLLVTVALTVLLQKEQGNVHGGAASAKLTGLWQEACAKLKDRQCEVQGKEAAGRDAQRQLKERETALAAQENILAALNVRKEETVAVLHRHIKAVPEELAFGEWGAPFVYYGKKIVEQRKKLERIEEETSNKSALERILLAGAGREKVNLEKAIEDTVNACVYTAKEKWDEGMRSFPAEMGSALETWEGINAVYNKELNVLQQLEAQVSAGKDACVITAGELAQSKKQLHAAQRRYWGPAQLVPK